MRPRGRENLKQIEGLTDWLMVRHNRIFLPPDPLASLVPGSVQRHRTDDGSPRPRGAARRTTAGTTKSRSLRCSGSSTWSSSSRSSSRSLRSSSPTTRSTAKRNGGRSAFPSPTRSPRRVYITGKLLGSFLALAVPLLIPILIWARSCSLSWACPCRADEWARLALIVVAGILYFGAFLTIALAVSALTVRSSSSFLMLLVIWMFAVLIIPAERDPDRGTRGRRPVGRRDRRQEGPVQPAALDRGQG